VSARGCTRYELLLALLYRVVEVEGRRVLWDAVRELRRRGASEVEIVVSLVPQLECSRWGEDVRCRARELAWRAYWKCRGELERREEELRKARRAPRAVSRRTRA
jgi:hypothetical protein